MQLMGWWVTVNQDWFQPLFVYAGGGTQKGDQLLLKWCFELNSNIGVPSLKLRRGKIRGATWQPWYCLGGQQNGYINTHSVSFLDTLPKTNMDTQNDGLEKVTPFKHGNFWLSMLDFWGVLINKWKIFTLIHPFVRVLHIEIRLIISSDFTRTSAGKVGSFCRSKFVKCWN